MPSFSCGKLDKYRYLSYMHNPQLFYDSAACFFCALCCQLGTWSTASFYTSSLLSPIDVLSLPTRPPASPLILACAASLSLSFAYMARTLLLVFLLVLLHQYYGPLRSLHDPVVRHTHIHTPLFSSHPPVRCRNSKEWRGVFSKAVDGSERLEVVR